MTLHRWLTGTAFLAAAAVGPSAFAGPFDFLRRAESANRADERTDREERRERAERRPKAEARYASFEVRDKDQIGQFVETVSYQPTLADGRLVPVPEPAPAYGPRTAAGPSFVAPLPGPGYSPPPQGIVVDHYGPGGLPGGYGPDMLGPGFGPGGPLQPIGPGPEGFPLYPNVRYKDADAKHIHPCAVPRIVQVLDPCPADPCSSCGPRCVYVQVCLPPGCPRIKVEDGGRKVKYKYDDYQVEIESEDGCITVDYDD